MNPVESVAPAPPATFRLGTWLVLGTGLALAAAALATQRSYNIYDEAWFLQVVDRVLAGDALYDEVFYSPLPLAVYLAAGPAAVVATHAFVVDALWVAIATASALLVAWATLRLGGSRALGGSAAIATILFAPPLDTAPYSALAGTFAVGALAVLVGRSPLTLARAGTAGVLIGLAFASKQNVGALAFGAAVVGVLIAGGRLRSLFVLGGAAAGVVAIVLVPVAAQGALDDLVELGFTGKGEYLDTPVPSYGSVLDSAVLKLRMGDAFDDPFGWLTTMPPVFLPVLAAVAFLLGLAFGTDDRRGLLVAGAFGAASFAGAYPRFDHYHLAAAAPCLVVVLAGACAQLSPRLRRRADAVLLVLAVAFTASLIVGTVDGARDLRVATLPHLDGVRLTPQFEEIGRQWQAGLEPGAPVFVVRQDAGFAYLVSGAVNPTRFDYPASSNIGESELRELDAAIAGGAVRRACIGGPPGFLEPVAVDALVARTMRPERSISRCMLYRARGR